MKKLLIAVIILNSVNLAQTAQSIELPDFVITGSKTVSIPDVQKNLPEYKANYSKLQFDEITANINFHNPKIPEPKLLLKNKDSISIVKKGNLSVGAGLYTQPIGRFFISSGFEHVRLNVNLMGINEKDYLKYSRYNKSNVDGALYFFISPKSYIFPGAKITFKGNYSKEAYRLFGSSNPAQRRENDYSGTQISFSNFYSNYLNYGINFKTDQIKMKSDNLQHISMAIEPQISLKFNSFKVFANASINTNKIYSANSKYYSNQKIGGGIDLYFVRDLSLKLGVDYFDMDNSKFLKPYLESIFRMNNYFSISGRFKPYVSCKSHNEYLESNKYFDANSINRVLENHLYYSEISFLFEIQKLLQIQLGLHYDRVDSLAYFSAQGNSKNFTVQTISNVNTFGSNLNLTLTVGSLGDLYFEALWQTFFNNQKIYVPYHPNFSLSTFYRNKISEKFSFETKLKYVDEVYFSPNKREKLPSSMDLGVKVEYYLSANLNLFVDIENVLNRKNYYLKYYQSKPMDIVFGVNYKW